MKNLLFGEHHGSFLWMLSFFCPTKSHCFNFSLSKGKDLNTDNFGGHWIIRNGNTEQDKWKRKEMKADSRIHYQVDHQWGDWPSSTGHLLRSLVKCCRALCLGDETQEHLSVCFYPVGAGLRHQILTAQHSAYAWVLYRITRMPHSQSVRDALRQGAVGMWPRRWDYWLTSAIPGGGQHKPITLLKQGLEWEVWLSMADRHNSYLKHSSFSCSLDSRPHLSMLLSPIPRFNLRCMNFIFLVPNKNKIEILLTF